MVLKRGKYFLALTAFISLLLSLVVLSTLDKRYTSVATVLPSNSTSPDLNPGGGQFSGIGFLMGINNSRDNLPLYPVILRSRRVSRDIIKRQYTFDRNGETVDRTLMEYLGATSEDAAIFKLRSRVAAFKMDRESNTLVIRVVTGNPELSAQVGRAYIDRLEQFNRNDHRSNSEKVYHFIQKKVEENRAALNLAEEKLRLFRERNRNFNISTSPELQMKHRRLLRRVEVERALFIEFGKQLKKATVDMKRDTPVLNVLDSGAIPSRPSWPNPALFILAFMLAGVMGGTIFLIIRESFRRWREGNDSRMVEELIGELKGDLRSVPLLKNRL